VTRVTEDSAISCLTTRSVLDVFVLLYAKPDARKRTGVEAGTRIKRVKFSTAFKTARCESFTGCGQVNLVPLRGAGFVGAC